MSANPVSSAPSPAQQLLQSNHLQQAAAAKPADEAKKSSQAQQQQLPPMRQPGPVTNMQGQATGTYINTTA